MRAQHLGRLAVAVALAAGMAAAGSHTAHAGFTSPVPFTVDFDGPSTFLSPTFVAGPQGGDYGFQAQELPAAEYCAVTVENATGNDGLVGGAGVPCTLSSSGRYSMSFCLTGTVSGSGTLVVPDATIDFTYAAEMANGSGPVVGSWSGGTVTGHLNFIPGQVCSPISDVTSFTATGHLTFTWSAPAP